VRLKLLLNQHECDSINNESFFKKTPLKKQNHLLFFKKTFQKNTFEKNKIIYCFRIKVAFIKAFAYISKHYGVTPICVEVNLNLIHDCKLLLLTYVLYFKKVAILGICLYLQTLWGNSHMCGGVSKYKR
jgi:hypothetical protein